MLGFIVVAHSRSGSSYLMHVLSQHPHVYGFQELFNRFYPRIPAVLDDWFGMRSYHEAAGVALPVYVAEFLERLSAKFEKDAVGFKFFWDQLSGLSRYQLLHQCGLRVIVLRRRNLLRAAVSYVLAKRTGRWQASDESREPLPCELDVRLVRRTLLDFARQVEESRDATAALQPMTVEYETVFTETVLSDVFAFLDLEPMPYANDLSQKVNSRLSYQRNITNAGDIDAELGSDETGWLFGVEDYAA